MGKEGRELQKPGPGASRGKGGILDISNGIFCWCVPFQTFPYYSYFNLLQVRSFWAYI